MSAAISNHPETDYLEGNSGRAMRSCTEMAFYQIPRNAINK